MEKLPDKIAELRISPQMKEIDQRVIQPLTGIDELATQRGDGTEDTLIALDVIVDPRVSFHLNKIQDFLHRPLFVPDHFLKKDELHILLREIPQVLFDTPGIISLGEAQILEPAEHDTFPVETAPEDTFYVTVKSLRMSAFSVIPHGAARQKSQRQKIFVGGVTAVSRVAHEKDQFCLRRKIPADLIRAAPEAESRVHFPGYLPVLWLAVSKVSVFIPLRPEKRAEKWHPIEHGLLDSLREDNLSVLL